MELSGVNKKRFLRYPKRHWLFEGRDLPNSARSSSLRFSDLGQLFGFRSVLLPPLFHLLFYCWIRPLRSGAPDLMVKFSICVLELSSGKSIHHASLPLVHAFAFRVVLPVIKRDGSASTEPKT